MIPIRGLDPLYSEKLTDSSFTATAPDCMVWGCCCVLLQKQEMSVQRTDRKSTDVYEKIQ